MKGERREQLRERQRKLACHMLQWRLLCEEKGNNEQINGKKMLKIDEKGINKRGKGKLGKRKSYESIRKEKNRERAKGK